MKKEKISNKYIQTDSKNGTNLSAIMDYQGERTVLSYHADRKYKLPAYDKTNWIYFSSICGNHKEFNAKLVDYVKNKKIKLGFNPGSRQMALGMEKLKSVFAVCEVVFLNKQEAQRLTNKKGNIKMLLQEMMKTGAKLVVITDGRRGSHCYDNKNMYQIGIINLPLVENTGCGDAYASGFVAALINGHEPPEAMRWGSINAASAGTKMGSQAGLLTKKELKKLLKEHDHFQANIL